MAAFGVDELKFKSKAEVKRLLRAYREGVANGTRVSDPDIAELLTLLAELHLDYEKKFSPGIDYWIVQDNADLGYVSTGYRAVILGRVKPEVFSYTDVLDNPTPWTNLQEAFAKAADDITYEFREAAFANGPFECPVTRKLLERPTQARARHVNPSRRQLHQDFLREEGLMAEEVELVKDEQRSGYRIADQAIVERWRRYQKDHLSGMRVEWNPQSRDLD